MKRKQGTAICNAFTMLMLAENEKQKNFNIFAAFDSFLESECQWLLDGGSLHNNLQLCCVRVVKLRVVTMLEWYNLIAS